MSTQPSNGRAWVEIDLDHLLANARAVLAQTPRAQLLPMVKADAYGLGAVACARALERLEPWGFGVATVQEGKQLRDAGIQRPILVFTPAQPDQLDTYRRHDLRAVLDRPETISIWTIAFHLEIDTGMARCGVRWDDGDALERCASPHLEGVFIHLAAADADPASVAVQWDRFTQARRRLGMAPGLVHVANSAGAWRLSEELALVRPGIYLYGGRLAPDLPTPLPVAAVRAPVVSIRRLAAGDSVSYGGDWRAPRATTVATLGIGYADGVPRAVQDRASVLLGGMRYPVVGRVTMDFVMVDLGSVPPPLPVAVGDVATLIGSDGRDTITVDEFAAWAGTISYEILARLGARVERRYVGG
jgi:alanine racemase